MSVLMVPLYLWLLPNPCSRAAITSGRVRWFSREGNSVSVCVESPTTRPSLAMNVTRAEMSSAEAIRLTVEVGVAERRGF